MKNLSLIHTSWSWLTLRIKGTNKKQNIHPYISIIIKEDNSRASHVFMLWVSNAYSGDILMPMSSTTRACDRAIILLCLYLEFICLTSAVIHRCYIYLRNHWIFSSIILMMLSNSDEYRMIVLEQCLLLIENWFRTASIDLWISKSCLLL